MYYIYWDICLGANDKKFFDAINFNKQISMCDTHLNQFW